MTSQIHSTISPEIDFHRNINTSGKTDSPSFASFLGDLSSSDLQTDDITYIYIHWVTASPDKCHHKILTRKQTSQDCTEVTCTETHSFVVSGPSVWNDLPPTLRVSLTGTLVTVYAVSVAPYKCSNLFTYLHNCFSGQFPDLSGWPRVPQNSTNSKNSTKTNFTDLVSYCPNETTGHWVTWKTDQT